jgi:hypothetical protein
VHSLPSAHIHISWYKQSGCYRYPAKHQTGHFREEFVGIVLGRNSYATESCSHLCYRCIIGHL